MALPATRALARYRELMDEYVRQNKIAPVSDSKFKQFEEALEICRNGMAPQERAEVDKVIEGARLARKVADNQVSFEVDTSQMPYTVPCPTCNAYALAACRDKPRSRLPGSKWPEDARILSEAHPARLQSWHEHPQWRVRAMK